MLDGVLGPIHRGHVGAAVDVVAGHVILVFRQAIAQEDHALAGVGEVFAFRESPNQFVQRGECHQCVPGRALGHVHPEHSLEEIRCAVEVDEPLHVEAVIHPGMGWILLFELVGGIDGGLRLLSAVIDIDHVELRLPGHVAERVAGFELLKVGQRRGVVAASHGRGTAVVEFLGARGFHDPVAAVAASGGQHGRGCRDEHEFSW